MSVSRIAFMVVVLLILIGGIALLTGSGSPEAVVQPLAFSHKLHAGENRIPCLYCHGNARRAAVAGIPSLSRCLGCHRSIKSDATAIETLKSYWKKQQPIRWIKVYDQPDFVHFSHKRHLRKGIGCQTCHGEVETMEEIREAVVLNMDRCSTCHIKHQASIDCLTCHK